MANLWRSIRFSLVFAVLLGLIYPLCVTGIGNLLFPFQAQGSLIHLNGQVVGSDLIAQSTTNPGLFHPRPSAVKYAGNGSGGSNLGSTNPALLKEVKANLKSLDLSANTPVSKIPPEMVESSASGLDPDISIEDALLQIPRIAKATGIRSANLKLLVTENQERRFLGIFGEPMVNVMKLNVSLERKLGR